MQGVRARMIFPSCTVSSGGLNIIVIATYCNEEGLQRFARLFTPSGRSLTGPTGCGENDGTKTWPDLDLSLVDRGILHEWGISFRSGWIHICPLCRVTVHISTVGKQSFHRIGIFFCSTFLGCSHEPTKRCQGRESRALSVVRMSDLENARRGLSQCVSESWRFRSWLVGVESRLVRSGT